MEEKERDDIVSILREAQEIVEDAIGVTGSSVVRDQLVLSLAGTLVSRYWSSKKRGTSALGLPFPFDLAPPKSDKPDPATETAFRLLNEIKFAGNKGQDPKWVWQTYQYFLKQARKQLAGRHKKKE